jgi:tetratricopeptide (TPR) repeat protein
MTRDDTLTEAHISLEIINTWSDYDWVAAEREFKRALELNSNYAPAHHWYGFYLLIRGRPNESIAEAKMAVELDPVATESNLALATYLFYAGRYEEALKHLQSTLELDPKHWFCSSSGKELIQVTVVAAAQ